MPSSEEVIDIQPQNPRHARRSTNRLVASSAPLLLASASFLAVASETQAAARVPATAPKAGAKVTGAVKVPASAMAALSHAQRLQRNARPGDAATQVQIEAALRQAIDAAPQWVEARRALARWHSSRRQWSAAQAAWQSVLQLRASDREARTELNRAQRWTRNFPKSTLWSEVSLVRLNMGLGANTGVGTALPAQPAIPKADPQAAAPTQRTDNGAVTVAQLPEGLPTIQIPDEGALPVGTLPHAPEGISEEARVALARARQMATLVDFLPEAAAWAATEFRRATELEPEWTQAQRERALWHTGRSEWSEAARAWEGVLAVSPDDLQARTALDKTQRFAFAFDLWGDHNMVSFGHDSQNPLAQPDRATLLAWASPLASDSIKVAAMSGATDIRMAEAPETPEAGAQQLASAQGAPGVVRPQAIVTSSALMARVVSPFSAAMKRMAYTGLVPAPVIHSSSQAAPTLDNELGSADGVMQPVPARTAPLATQPAPRGATPATGQPSIIAIREAQRASAATPRVAVAATNRTRRATTRNTRSAPQRRPAARAAVRPAVRPQPVSAQRKAAAWPLVNRAGKAMAAKNFPAALNLYQQAYKLDPTNPYAALGVPQALSILKRYPEAIRGFERFLATNPGHSKGLRGLADAYAFSGQYQNAVRINSQLLAQNPRDFDAALQSAQVMAWAKNYEESGRFYRRALAIQPNNSGAWTEYAETLSFSKDPRAREAFGQALRLNPASQRATVGLANMLSWSGEFENAIPLYRNLVAREPSNLLARIGLGDALTFSSQSAAAIPHYQEALRISPTSVQARLGLGRALTIARRNDEAVALLTPLVREQPTNEEALLMLGTAQMSEQPGAALATFQNLLKVQDDPRERAATLGNIGELQVKLGQAVEGRATYEEALRLAPADNTIALAYARALMRQELYNEAEPVIAGVLQREGTNQAALLLQATLAARTDQSERAALLSRQVEALPTLEVSDDALNLFYALRGAGDTAAANRLLARLTESSAQRPEDALKVANAVRDTGQEEASYDLYRRILQANPNLHEARLQLAEALVRRKEYDAAQTEVNYVLARQPANVEAKVLGATLSLRRDQSDDSINNAVIVLSGALAQDPNNVSARIALADAQATRSNFLEAVQNYRAVLTADPENLQARLGLARNLYYSKQVPESIKEYQDLIQRVPDDSIIKLELAQIYLDRNLLEDAQRLFVDVLKSANYPLPESNGTQLSQRVPGSGQILSEATRRAFRDFAAQERQNAANVTGGTR